MFLDTISENTLNPIKKIDLNPHKECGSGIHFVNSIIDAENFLRINVLQDYCNYVQEGKADDIWI